MLYKMAFEYSHEHGHCTVFCKMVQIVRWMYEKNPITGPKELGLSSKNIEYVKSWSVHL